LAAIDSAGLAVRQAWPTITEANMTPAAKSLFLEPVKRGPHIFMKNRRFHYMLTSEGPPIKKSFHAKAQRTQRRKGESNPSGTSESLTRLCAFAFFAPLREPLS